jgi:SPASM domain peptide maturase of grasp-with-spasm system
MSKKVVPILFSCCIPVKGAKRSIVCDVQRSTFLFVPNLIYDILTKERGSSIEEINILYPEHSKDIYDYFSYLEENEYLFYTDSPKTFPQINIKEWDEPSLITNAIIDIDNKSKYNIEKALTQLGDLGCRNIQIRFFSERGISYFEGIFSVLKNIHIYSLELIIKYSNIDYNEFLKFKEKYKYIQSIIIHSTPSSVLDALTKQFDSMIFMDEIIESESHCGIVAPHYFTLNIKSFSEAQLWNTCLNRKISIDKSGNIKNCPSMKLAYGNINTDNLSESINEKFKKVWRLNKDQVSICKDCEFRYICTDCRAYVQNEADSFSKPLKCDYNPYTGIGFEF